MKPSATGEKEFDNLPIFILLSLISAIFLGIYFSTRQIITVTPDFYEKIPEEITIQLLRESYVSLVERDVKSILKGINCGGGDPRARVTKRGAIELTKSAFFEEKGFSNVTDAFLQDIVGLKSVGNSSYERKGVAGIGYGAGYGSGFGGFVKKPQVAENSEDKFFHVKYSPILFKDESVRNISENKFFQSGIEPLSTFSIDVDNASYCNITKYVNQNMIPPPEIIRIEEMINNFSYSYPEPSGKHPLSIITELSCCPWNIKHKILRIGIKGRSLPPQGPPPSNFVFLLDVSGSMAESGRLPLFKKVLRSFVFHLSSKDRISIITYAGKADNFLGSTPGNQKEPILAAIDKLKAGGSTSGSEGIQLAYRLVNRTFIPGGNNRIILVTDGNFNVGLSNESELIHLIEKKRGNAIFLTVIGMNIENDDSEHIMERLADNGDGNFSSVYNEQDLYRVLGNLSSSFFTVAKDVKIQVDFNSNIVQSYRLIGYENRMLKNGEFSDDTKDAGEIGAEQTVTALYEIIPAQYEKNVSQQKPCTINIRYKEEDTEGSKILRHVVHDLDISLERSSNDFRFSTAVAGMGMLLRKSSYKGTLTYDAVLNLATSALGGPHYKERSEFVEIVNKCKRLSADSPAYSFK